MLSNEKGHFLWGMQTRHTLLLVAAMIWLLTGPTSAQINKPAEWAVCHEIESALSANLKISKFLRRAFSDDECRFEFAADKESFLLSVEKYSTADEAEKALLADFDFLTLAETYPENVMRLPRKNYWNQAIGYTSAADSDHLVLLRYRSSVITIISSSYDMILSIEPVLKSIRLEKRWAWTYRGCRGCFRTITALRFKRANP